MNEVSSPKSRLSIHEMLSWGADQLARSGIDSPRLDARLLMSHIMGESPFGLIAQTSRELTERDAGRFMELIGLRAKRVPAHYLTGWREFYSRRFFVNESVLIPRPETEVLVEEVLRLFKDGFPPVVVDAGTGSGVIAVTLALEANSRVYALDVSRQALEVARKNAFFHGVADRVELIAGPFPGCLNDLGLHGRIDLLVSNPPYIATGEIARLMPEVALYEPRIALDGGSDGLSFYRLMADAFGKGLLRAGGVVAVEVGAGQAGAVMEMFRLAGLSGLRTVQDYSGYERVVLGFWQGCGMSREL